MPRSFSSAGSEYRNAHRRDAYEDLTGERAPSVLVPPSSGSGHRRRRRHRSGHAGEDSGPSYDGIPPGEVYPDDSVSQMGSRRSRTHGPSRSRRVEEDEDDEDYINRRLADLDLEAERLRGPSSSSSRSRSSRSAPRPQAPPSSFRYDRPSFDIPEEDEDDYTPSHRHSAMPSFNRDPSSSHGSSRRGEKSSRRESAHQPTPPPTYHSRSRLSSEDEYGSEFDDGDIDPYTRPLIPPSRSRPKSSYDTVDVDRTLRIGSRSDGRMQMERSRGANSRNYDRGPDGGIVVQNKSGKKTEVPKWLMYLAGGL